MCCLPVAEIGIGTDGCSAPNFAMPLFHAAWGYARLCDPVTSGVEPQARREACQTITAAMSSHPDMVSGHGHFDTRLMEQTQGRLVSKGGAEGYQSIGLQPGAIHPGSPALGIAIKIADGDARGKVRAAVGLEVLHQVGALSEDELHALSSFGPVFPILNWRKLKVGQASPTFQLEQPVEA
jgi:L-asparaginase II